MADSNITKKALAASLRALLIEDVFDKISIGDICEKCEMNRKSFYYHFKDKYDLVNWIFKSEFLSILQVKGTLKGWNMLEELCDYFYINRVFYRKTLNVEGQNSFTDYFGEIVASIIELELDEIFRKENPTEFFVSFYTDAFVRSIKSWIMNKNLAAPADFAKLLKICLLGVNG